MGPSLARQSTPLINICLHESPFLPHYIFNIIPNYSGDKSSHKRHRSPLGGKKSRAVGGTVAVCEGGGGAQPNSRAVNLRSREGERGGALLPIAPRTILESWTGRVDSSTTRRGGRDDFVGKAPCLAHEQFYTDLYICREYTGVLLNVQMYNAMYHATAQLAMHCNALAVCGHCGEKGGWFSVVKRELLTRWYCAVLHICTCAHQTDTFETLQCC